MAEKIKQSFDESKPHVNIGTIGHVDHGKTTLAAAITSVLAKQTNSKTKKRSYSEIDNAPEEKTRGITIKAADVEFETDKRHYSLSDCPGHADYVKNMITGASELDGAILVISSKDSVVDQTEEHMLLAKQIGVEKIVIFINDWSPKGEELDELEKEVLESDVKEYLEKYGYDEDSPIVVASAQKSLEKIFDKKRAIEIENPNYEPKEEEKILKLVEIIDNYIPVPAWRKEEENKPFFMYIKEKFSIPSLGTIVSGIVKRGKLEAEDEVEIVGGGKRKKGVKVRSIESEHKQLKKALPGHNIGVNLRGVGYDEVERGQVLASPGTVSMYKKFKAHTYILSAEERGRKNEFGIGYRPQLYFSSLDITGTIVELPEGKEKIEPGERVELTIELIEPTPLEKLSSFIMREGNHTIGTGVISEIDEKIV